MRRRAGLRTRVLGQRGAALVETALVLPLILLVSVSIFEFGRAFQTWQVLTNAAREGARIAILPGTVDSDVTARVQQYVTGGQLTGTATVAIDHNQTISIGTGTATASKVTVNYPFSFMVLSPVAKLLVSNSALGADFTMSTSAEMRNE
jgi:Flp pilus assembly protein TadG